MDKLQWITDRLPVDHGFEPAKIQAVLDDPEGADGVKELALADLLEQLASQDRYNAVTIGSTSYSNPILMERARLWRGRAPTSEQQEAGAGSFVFVRIAGRSPGAPRYDEYGAGAEV